LSDKPLIKFYLMNVFILLLSSVLFIYLIIIKFNNPSKNDHEDILTLIRLQNAEIITNS
jgi:hypothetical protein